MLPIRNFWASGTQEGINVGIQSSMIRCTNTIIGLLSISRRDGQDMKMNGPHSKPQDSLDHHKLGIGDNYKMWR